MVWNVTDLAFLKKESGRHIFFSHSTSSNLREEGRVIAVENSPRPHSLTCTRTSYFRAVAVCGPSRSARKIYRLHRSEKQTPFERWTLAPCRTGHLTCHGILVDGIQTHDRDVEEDRGRISVLLWRPHLVVHFRIFREDVLDGQAGSFIGRIAVSTAVTVSE